MNKITRKNFLKMSGLLASSLLMNPIFGKEKILGRKTKVLVIGSGFSGVSAAKTLNDLGLEVIVLESRSSLGGRIRTFTDWGFPMDLGASWIHGPLTNPFTKIAKDLNIKLIQTPYDDVDFYENGERASIFKRFFSKYEYEKIVNKTKEESLRSSYSKTIQDIYGKLMQYEESNSRKNFINWFSSSCIENEMAADLDQLGARAYFESEFDLQGIDSLPETGYGPIIKSLAKNLNIIYDTKVNRISSKNKQVFVYTEGGKRYEADYCICSVPLGVLKSKKIVFEPALKEKQSAIDTLSMGTLNKIYTQWDEPWWDPKSTFIGIHEKKRTFPVTLSYGAHDKNTLLTFFQGKNGKELESRDNEDIIDLLVKNMETAFGKKLPKPKRYLITKWNKDENTLGSYSYFPKGSNGKEMETLKKAEGNIIFAGEHTSDLYGYAHGAYNSGILAAKSLVEIIR